MTTKAAELAIGITTEAADAVAGFGDVDRAADKMNRSVEAAGDTAQRTSRQLGISADAADELGGKAGKATGALGALSSGFELVGAEKYAGALQAAGMATDFMSGVGDSLNLVMESTIVQNARARVATIARTVAEKAAAAGTAAMTAGQWALNAALNANPISIIVLSVIALVGLMVLLYKKNEAVRNVINAVGRVGRQAIGAVVSAVGSLVGWVRDRLPAAFGTAKALVVGYLSLITLPMRTVVTVASNIVSWVREKIPAAFETARNKATAIKDALLAPFEKVADAVQKVINLIGKIKVPKLPDLNPFRTAGGGRGSSSAGSGYDPLVYRTLVQILATLQAMQRSTGTFDPYLFANALNDLLYRYGRMVKA